MRQVTALGILVLALALFGSEPVWAQSNSCEGDFNGDDEVTIDELVRAVNNSLNGCTTFVSPCAECMREKCLDLIEICAEEADCACMVDCTGEDGIPGVEECLDTCGLTERPANFVPVEVCTAVACPDTDECSTPDNWTPPGAEVTCDGTGIGGIGGGGLADCSFDPGLTFDPGGPVLQLQSADHSVCVRLERRNDGSGTLQNTKWTLIDIRVGPPGEVALVEDAMDQCWYSSHHNFRDWVHAWTGTRHFDLQLTADPSSFARRYDLYVFEQGPVDTVPCAPAASGSMCIDGPIELFPVNP